LFQLFAKELSHLGDADASYYTRTTYLLENLATVKSLCLIADLSKPDELATLFFNSLFSAAETQTGETVLVNMVDLLVQLVEECPSLSIDAVELVVMQFAKSGRGLKMAVELCKQANSHMQRYLCTVRLQITSH